LISHGASSGRLSCVPSAQDSTLSYSPPLSLIALPVARPIPRGESHLMARFRIDDQQHRRVALRPGSRSWPCHSTREMCWTAWEHKSLKESPCGFAVGREGRHGTAQSDALRGFGTLTHSPNQGSNEYLAVGRSADRARQQDLITSSSESLVRLASGLAMISRATRNGTTARYRRLP
jgi:hypothetical protein